MNFVGKINLMNAHYKNLIEQLELCSRIGRGREVPKLFKTLNYSKIPRAYRIKLANLARRNGLPLISIKILNPVVRNETLIGNQIATVEELSEYAVALHYIGANSEAEALLKSLESSAWPQVSLYRSFVLFSRWNYGEAIPHLQKFIEESHADAYQVTIGEVNLAAALIFEGNLEKASTLLKKLRKITLEKGYFRLYGNCLELSAQAEFETHDYKKALHFLEEAKKRLRENSGLDQFLVEKWKILVSLHKEGETKINLNRLNKLKLEALRFRHWETLRDLDFYKSLVTQNQDLFLKVYFCTPYESYQKKMLDKMPLTWEIPSFYILESDLTKRSLQKNSKKRLFDVKSGADVEGKSKLSVGKSMHKLLCILAQDIYHPKALGGLYSELYRGEYFNPHSSPGRVHQLVKRLRNWLELQKLNIQIVETMGGYHLVVGKGLSLRLDYQRNDISDKMEKLEKLKKNFAGRYFSAREASLYLGISRASYLRFCEQVIGSGLLNRENLGPATRYKIIDGS